MRPKNLTDLDIMWGIRDIPPSILKLNEKGFLLLFLSYIGNNDNCWYKAKTLAKELGISERHLYRIIEKFESINFIIVERPMHNSRNNTNLYRLNYEQIMAFSVKKKNTKSYPQRMTKMSGDDDDRMTKMSGSHDKNVSDRMTKMSGAIRKKKYNEEIHKDTEESAVENAHLLPVILNPDLYNFKPDSQNVNLSRKLSLSLDVELEKFLNDWKDNQKKYQNPQSAFSSWLSKSNKFQQKINNVRSSVNKKPFFQSGSDLFDKSKINIEYRESVLNEIREITSKLKAH